MVALIGIWEAPNEDYGYTLLDIVKRKDADNKRKWYFTKYNKIKEELACIVHRKSFDALDALLADSDISVTEEELDFYATYNTPIYRHFMDCIVVKKGFNIFSSF